MKKLICLLLIFTMMLTACSKWKVEIVDPTKPIENDSELVISEEEKTEETEENILRIEDFNKIMVYSDETHRIKHEFSREELSEWISIIKPEEWIEVTSERESKGIYNPICLSAFNEALYICSNSAGEEIAVIIFGEDAESRKEFILPENTVAAAKDFETKIIKENPNVFTFPECNYEMSVGAFEKRENDDYILYLDELLMYCDWTAAKDDFNKPYTGFENSRELNSKILFNVFMFVFDYCGYKTDKNLTDYEWFDSNGEKYHIPMDDIYTILGKYFSNYWVNMEETSVNYELDENNNVIAIGGGYGITSTRYDDRKVVSVINNEDGTLTAVVEYHVYHMDENDNMILSEKPEKRNTIVFRPETFRCVILNHKIESIGD